MRFQKSRAAARVDSSLPPTEAALLLHVFGENRCQRHNIDSSPPFIHDHESLCNVGFTILDRFRQEFTGSEYGLVPSSRGVRQVYAFVIAYSTSLVRHLHGDGNRTVP